MYHLAKAVVPPVPPKSESACGVIVSMCAQHFLAKAAPAPKPPKQGNYNLLVSLRFLTASPAKTTSPAKAAAAKRAAAATLRKIVIPAMKPAPAPPPPVRAPSPSPPPPEGILPPRMRPFLRKSFRPSQGPFELKVKQLFKYPARILIDVGYDC